MTKSRNYQSHKRCSFVGCNAISKPGVNVTQLLCIRHGGGFRCSEIGCNSLAKSPYDIRKGFVPLCVKHGGGFRCKIKDCNDSRIICSTFKYCVKHTKKAYKCHHKNCKRIAGLSKCGYVLCNYHNYQGETCSKQLSSGVYCKYPCLSNNKRRCIKHTSSDKTKFIQKKPEKKQIYDKELYNFLDFLEDIRVIRNKELDNLVDILMK